MRPGSQRTAALLAALALAAAQGLAAAGAHAEGAAAVGAASPGFIDAVPAGPSLDERLEEIRRRVQGALRYPPVARRRGQTGEVVVGFEVDSQRGAREIRTEQSSGIPLLDRAAERAVREAAPLPPVYGRVEVPIRFELDERR